MVGRSCTVMALLLTWINGASGQRCTLWKMSPNNPLVKSLIHSLVKWVRVIFIYNLAFGLCVGARMLSQSISLRCCCFSLLLGAGFANDDHDWWLALLPLPSAFLFLRPSMGITLISLLIKSDTCLMLRSSSVLMIALSHPLIFAI